MSRDTAPVVRDVDAAKVRINGPEAFEGMRRAGRLAAETLDFIVPHVRPGVTTGELDRLCAAMAGMAIPAACSMSARWG